MNFSFSFLKMKTHTGGKPKLLLVAKRGIVAYTLGHDGDLVVSNKMQRGVTYC